MTTAPTSPQSVELSGSRALLHRSGVFRGQYKAAQDMADNLRKFKVAYESQLTVIRDKLIGHFEPDSEEAILVSQLPNLAESYDTVAKQLSDHATEDLKRCTTELGKGIRVMQEEDARAPRVGPMAKIHALGVFHGVLVTSFLVLLGRVMGWW